MTAREHDTPQEPEGYTPRHREEPNAETFSEERAAYIAHSTGETATTEDPAPEPEERPTIVTAPQPGGWVRGAGEGEDPRPEPRHARREELAPATQTEHPWRTTVRSIFQALVALAIAAPLIYEAASGQDPAAATGWAATGLAVAAGVARVMALPAVNDFLRRFVPFLAPDTPGTRHDRAAE